MEKNIIKIAFLLLILCFSSVAAFCEDANNQPSGSNVKRAGKPNFTGEKSGALKALNLTDAQMQQLKALKEKRMQERTQFFEETKNKIKSILTPEQQTIWEEKTAELKTKAGGAGGKGNFQDKGRNSNAGGGLKILFGDMNLTDEQKAKVKSAMQEIREKRQANMQNYDNELKSILTPDQYEKFKSFKGNKGLNKGGKGSKNMPAT